MPFLRAIGIRCYRGIVDAHLPLGEITVVVGRSDSGKSCLVRAIRDWAYNARGSSCVTIGHDTTRVGVSVQGTHKVVWDKSSKQRKHGATRYLVQETGSDEVISYERVGRSVPNEVTEITEFRKFEVDDVQVKIQISEQAEAWFLLAPEVWSPGRVAKVIGKVSGIDALVLASRDLKNTARGYQSTKINPLQASIDEAEVKLADYDDLDQLEKVVVRAEKLQARLEESQKSLVKVSATLKTLKEARLKREELDTRAEAIRAVVEFVDSTGVLENLEAIQEVESHQREIKGLLSRSSSLDTRETETKERIEVLQEELREVAQSQDLECPLCGLPAHQECREALVEEGQE